MTTATLKLSVKEMLAIANASIETISTADAIQHIDDEDYVFIDVRDDNERSKHGKIKGAVPSSRGLLEFYADSASSVHKPAFSSGKKLVIYCASGVRSSLAAKTLSDMGIPNVLNLVGGYGAWQEAGGPVESGD